MNHSLFLTELTPLGVLIITFNRVERKNALNSEMYYGIANVINNAAINSDVNCVLLRGHKKAFSAGADIKESLSSRDDTQTTPSVTFLEALNQFPKPIVAAVSGIAVGIGMTMLLHCDLVYASPETRFRTPFTQLGLTPEGGSSLLLPLIMGHRKAARWLMLGEFISAQEANAMGVTTEIFSLDNLFQEALKRAETLAQLPVSSLLATKSQMKKNTANQSLQRLREEIVIFNEYLKSEESMRIRNSFIKH